MVPLKPNQGTVAESKMFGTSLDNDAVRTAMNHEGDGRTCGDVAESILITSFVRKAERRARRRRVLLPMQYSHLDCASQSLVRYSPKAR